MKNVLIIIFMCILAIVMIFSGWQIWQINVGYENEAKIHSRVMEYKPDESKPGDQGNDRVNQGILDLQEKYPDAAGWLTIPGTNIDYPFVWYSDNEYYLRRDMDGNYAWAGTIFMDYRCNKDFTSGNTILYGHNMKNDSMFGTLRLFNDQSFINANNYGTIYLPEKTLKIEFFAYIVVNSDNEKELYNVSLSDNYIQYVQQNAKFFRDIRLTARDRIVTLSSCTYEFEGARMVLLAKIIETKM